MLKTARALFSSRAQLAGAVVCVARATSSHQQRRLLAASASRPGVRVTIDALNERLRNAQYAVRGGILLEAQRIEGELHKAEALGTKTPYPFDKIIYCNIGNPQQLGQKPLSFHRQVLALMEYPALMDDPVTSAAFAPDVIARAKAYLAHEPRGTGPYAHSQGMAAVRKEIANFINARDSSSDADPNLIFLTNGASAGVDLLMRAMIRGPHDGIMVPIPQYPLYSATIPLLGGSLIKYYLSEQNNWGLSAEDLEDALKATEKSVMPRALVVINPGNPTGQCLTRRNMEEIISFCHRNQLVLLADEVYQENVYYPERYPFSSFRKVWKDMGANYKDLQLISFHSTSKGFIGECGKRGGYFEMLGFDEAVMAEIYKAMSISLCSNVTGQIMTGLMVNPPKLGEPSYATYMAERDEILASLKRRAAKLVAALNELEGVSCCAPTGAMYAFPTISVPPKAIAQAKTEGVAPDFLYCRELLRNAGLCSVPGSGFGQRDGTFHFRTTFLPLEEHIDAVILRMKDFHAQFMARYK